MKKIHSKILILLKEIDDICRRYSITYYAAGGTVIGAVRHKGFIPWDDDADLYMTRDNFYKFRDAVKKEKPEYRVLGCLDDNSHYPGTIPRYIDTTSSFIGKYHCLNTVEAGVLVDVFILDPCPSEKTEEYLGKLNLYAEINVPYYVHMYRMNDDYLKLYDVYKKKVKESGKKSVVKQLENELFSYKEDECDKYILRWATLTHVFDKEMFQKPVYFEYEDMTIPCPTKWYDYLVQLYGPDWMYVPEHIEDEGHNSIIDCDYKYTNYLIDAERFIPKAEAKKNYYERKDIITHKEQLQRPFVNEALMLKGLCVLEIVYKQLEKKGYTDKESLNNCSSTEIIRLFERYLETQCSVAYVGRMTHSNTYRFRNRMFIPLKDEYLEVLLNALICEGKFRQCKIILGMRKKRQELTPALVIVYKKIKLIYELLKKTYCKQYEEANNIFSLIDKKTIEASMSLQKLGFQIDIGLGKDSTEIVETLEKNSENDPEIIKIAGDYYYNRGDLEKAKELYKESLKNLSNGLMIQDIKNKFDLETAYKKSDVRPQKTEYQEAVMQLLSEIDEICRSNSINYFLFGKALYFAYFEGVLNDDKDIVSVIMKPEDAVKFIRLMESNPVENREIIYPLNDDLHRYHCINYQMKNSIDLTLENVDTTKNNKIHIQIFILKRKTQQRVKFFVTRAADYINTINQEVAADLKPVKAMPRKTQVYYYASHPIWKITGGKKFSEKVFNNYIDMASGDTNEKYFISKNNAKQSVLRYYDSNYFNNCETVELYGKKYKAPGNLDVFIKDVFGKFSSNYVKVRKKEDAQFRIVETGIEYDDIAGIIEKHPLDRNNYKDYKESIILNKARNERSNKISEYWDILLCAEARFKLYIHYLPKKNKLIELYREENFTELEKLLHDYDVIAREQIEKGFSVFFDIEIFEIYRELLIHNGEKKLAEELKEKVKPEHMEPIEILH